MEWIIGVFAGVVVLFFGRLVWNLFKPNPPGSSGRPPSIRDRR